MKLKYSTLILAILVLTSNYSFAQLGQPQQPSQSLDVPGGFDLGLPDSSAADPEYIAQEKFVDEMTTVYTWIASNSTQFVSGCRENREQLITTVNSVIQQAQETSSVCRQFEAEAAACDPELFCSRFEQGMPIPPGMESAFREAGLDPTNISVNDMTPDVAIKICKAQSGKELEKQKDRNEKMKDNLRSQVPAFRQKCEEYKKMMENQNQNGPRLPDFQFGMPQQGMPRGQPYPQQQMNPQQPFNPPQGEQNRPPEQQPYQPPENFNQPPPDIYVPSTEPVPEPAPVQEPAPAPEPAPVQEPAPEPAPAPEVTASSQPNLINVITGFTFILNLQETTEAPPQDYSQPPQDFGVPPTGFTPPQDFGQPPQGYGVPPQGQYGSPQGFDPGMPNNFGDNPQDFQNTFGNENRTYAPGTGPNNVQGYGSQQGQSYGPPQGQQYGPPQGGPGMGPSPEELCEMSDDELINSFMGNMDQFAPREKEIEAMCVRESSKMMREINGLKLGIAKCRANSAIDCAAKQESVKSCNEIKENPETVSKILVNTMCRRFGIRADSSEARGGLYDIATEFYNEDPALANQLGDTADKTLEDRGNLGFFNYVLGDSEYGGKLVERADKLRAVRESLVSEGNADPQAIVQIDSEINKLETEGNQFSNVFDIGRIGRMFGPKE